MKPNRRNPLFSNFFRSNTLATAIVVSLGVPSVHAASSSWNVNAAGNWATAGSWAGSVIPGSTTVDNTDVATFSFTLTAARIATVDATRYIGGISFGNTSAFGYTLSGGSLLLNSGGVIQTLAANGNHTDTISSPIRISGTTAATATFTAGATSATSLLSIGAVTGSATTGNTTTLTLNGTNTGANVITGIIGNGAGGGSLALNKSGAGTWVLSGANTYTGVTTISGGTLTTQSSGALGTTAGGTIIASGATLNLGSSLTNNGLNLGAEAISVSGTGVGGNGAITNSGTGAVGQQNAIQGAVTMTGPTTFGGTQRWDIRNGTLNGGGFNLTKVGTNSVFISGTGQMSNMGSITVQNGEFVMETGALASSTNTTGIFLAPTVGGTTASFRSWGNNVIHSANFTLDSSVAGTARLAVDNGITTHSGTITAIGANNQLDVFGSQTMNLTGTLAGAGDLNKVGGGTLLINSTGSTHTGAFNLNAGTLGGIGTLSSSVLNIAPATTLSPGLMGSAGTFGVTNAIVSAAGINTAVFNLGTAKDLVNVGTLTQNGTTNVVVAPGPGYAAGTYTLYDYGTLGGTSGFGGFTLGANHIDASLVNNVGAGSIDLQVNSTAVPTWSGVSNGVWSAGSLTNPVLPNFAFAPAPGGQVEFVANDAVLFDDTAAGTTNITLVGTVAPAVTRFNNSSLAYTLNGAISGVGQIIKDGTGTAALLSSPTTLGGLAINAGTLQLGNDSFTAGYTAGSIDIATGATLAVKSGTTNVATLGVAGATAITGTGTILLNSSAQDIYDNFTADRASVTISGDMTGFTGSIQINDGNRLTANTVNSLGGTSSITVNNGGTLYPNAALTYGGTINVSGLGWEEAQGASGAIRLGGGANLAGAINLTGDTRITAYGSTGTLSGLISGAADLDYGFRQISGGANSSGTINVTHAANSYSGDTSIIRATVNAATVANTGANSSLGSGSSITMEGGSLVVTGPGAMTTNRGIILNQLGQGGGNLGVSTSGAVVTYTGAITNGNANFPIANLDFTQSINVGTGGTIVLDTATPIRTSGTTIHRQNLTLAGSTAFTVDFATTGTTAAPLGAPGPFNVGNNTSGSNTGAVILTIQDSAVLTTYGEFDVGNQNSGIIQSTIVNQTGGTVNAMRGGLTQNVNNRAMRIGHWGDNDAVYNLSGGTLNAPNGTVGVGYDGTGTLNQTGGTANLTGLRLANAALAAGKSGTYNLSGGTLNLGALGMARVNGAANFNFNGGTYRATADHAISGNISINLQSGGGTIDTNGFNVNSASALLAGTVAGGILNKTGAGEFNVPTGNNTMDGTLNINGGSIGGAGTFTAATINVNNGGTLAGALTVSSPSVVTVASGGTLSPGANGGAGNGILTVSGAGGIALLAGSKIDITPATLGGDSLVVTNGMTGSTIFNVLPVGSTALAPDTYTLATAGNTTGLVAGLGAYPHLADGTAPVLTINPTTVTVTTSAAADSMIWSGAAGSAWNTATANQWNGLSGLNNGAAYFDGDLVTFDGTSAVGSVVVQAGGVRPANVSINSATTPYTLTGGGINGGGSLTHVAGTTVLANNNSYLGTTTITAGTLQVGNGGTSGTLGLGATTNNGTLSFNRSDASTYAGVISGTGTVRSDGTGTTTLAGINTYTGGTVISKGTMTGYQPTSFGTGTITLNDASTGASNTGLTFAAVTTDAAITIANPITVTGFGSGTVTIGSSERSLVGAGTLFTGALTLGRDVTMLGEWDRTTFSGVISGTADTITIARSPGLDAGNNGRVTWEQNNPFTAATPGAVPAIQILDGATLEVGGGGRNQIPDNATVNVQAGGTFQLATAGDSETIGNLTGAGTVRNRVATALNVTFGTADDTTFSGVINGGNSLSLIKQGTGTATWSGTLDNPSGNISVLAGTMVFAKQSTPFVHAVGSDSSIDVAGTLQLAGSFTNTRPEDDGRLASNTAPLNFPGNYVDQIYNNASLTVNGTLDMNGRSEAMNGLIGTAALAKVTNSVVGSTSILYLGRNNAATPSYIGTLEDGAGVLSLEKVGNGVQTLGGDNTYTGVTTIYGSGSIGTAPAIPGAITMTHVNALGSPLGGTELKGSRDGQYATLNITLAASTPAAPNEIEEPFAMYSETEGDQRTQIINTTESTRLKGAITLYGDGINQIVASQAAGDQLQINGPITGTSSGTLFLRGSGEMLVNSVINAPNLQIAKTEAGLMILNSTGNDYLDISLVAGTVRTDVVNALDTGAVLRMGQSGNSNVLNLNGNNQTVAAIRLNNGVADAFARTITSVAPATLTIDTPAANGGNYNYAGNLTGAISLLKTGAGTQVLSTPTSGVNSYTGDTVIQQGVLKIASSNLIPDGATAGNMMLSGGAGTGTFDLNGNIETIKGLHGTSGSTVTSNGAGTAILSVGGSATPATSATFAGTLRNNTDGGTGILSLVKNTGNTQILSGSNTYTGSTTVNAGTLQLDFAGGGILNILSPSSALVLNGGTLEIKGGAGEANIQVFNGVSGTGGTLQLTPNGATSIKTTLGAIGLTGAINFAGANTTVTGGVATPGSNNFITSTTTAGNDASTRLGAHLWNGTSWASTASDGVNTYVTQWAGIYSDIYNGTTPGPIAIPSGTPAAEVRILEASSGFTSVTLGASETINSLLMSANTTATTVDMGANTLTVGNGASATGAVAIASTGQSLTIGNTVDQGKLTAGTSGASTLSLNNQSSTSTLTVNSVIADNTPATGVVSLNTSGNVTLNGTNTYTGVTTLNPGTLSIASISIGGVAGTLGQASNAAANLVFNGGTLQYTGITPGSTDRAFTITAATTATIDIAPASNLTISGAIPVTTGSLTKTGTGTLVLTGANLHAGGTNVTAGTLQATVTPTLNPLGTGEVAVASGATILLNNTDLTTTTVNIANSFVGSGLIKLNFAASASNTNTTMNNVTWFTGTTQLSNSGANGNKWTIAGLGTLNSALIIDSGSQLFISGGTTTFSNGINIQGTGNAENRGAIRLVGTLGGDLTLAANTTIGAEGGTLLGNISGTAGTQMLTFGGSSTGNATLTGNIVDGAGFVALTKQQTGTLTLTGANTFSGGTTLSAGTLAFANGSLGSSGLITMDGGTLQWGAGNTQDVSSRITMVAAKTSTFNTNGNNVTFGSAVGGGTTAALNKTGAGTLTLGGTNTYTGITTIAGGTLSVATIGNGGVAGNLGAATNAATNLVFNTGTLQYTGATASTDRAFTITAATTATVDIASGSDLTISGATAATNGALTKTGLGTLTLSGVNLNTGAATVSAGTLVLSGNRTAAVGAITVGNLASNTGTLNVSNGTFTTGEIRVGSGDNTVTGIVNQTAATLTMSGNQILLGNFGSSTATAAGSNATGTYNLSAGIINGVASTTRGVILGTNTGATGIFNLSGGTLAMGTAALQIGRSDSGALNSTGVFNQTGGTASFGTMTIGGGTGSAYSGTSGTLTLTGGTFTAGAFTSMSVGDASSSTINIGGTADVTLPAFPIARGFMSTATVNFDGGTLRPAAASTTYMGGLTSANIKAGGAKFNVATGSNITVAQALLADGVSTGGGLTKEGLGALTLTGNSTYTGPTNVNAGMLVVNGSLSGTSAVAVANGASIGGSGTLNASTTISGILAPGNSIGTLTTTNDVTWNGVATASAATDWQFELGVSSSDLLDITGGGSDFRKNSGSGSVFRFDFLNTGVDNGTFTLVQWGSTASLGGGTTGTDFGLSDFSYTGLDPVKTGSFSFSGSSLQFTVIPEPSAFLLGGLGALALLRRRRSA